MLSSLLLLLLLLFFDPEAIDPRHGSRCIVIRNILCPCSHGNKHVLNASQLSNVTFTTINCATSQIISVLKTFIDHKASRSVDELVKNYPHLEEETKKWYGGSKSTFDFPNKYFLMYFDESADSTSKTTSKARSVERKWRSWVDSDFVHRISPNIYGSFDQSLEAFR